MERMCRSCLLIYDDSSDLLQYTERRRRLFVYSTNLQIKQNDPIPFQLCKDCHNNMIFACKFKKMCRTSDKKLKHFLTFKSEEITDMDNAQFLKIFNDTSRFSTLNKSSTPLHKFRDDENESTVMSIGNFMTDMLQDQGLPDSEARIIKKEIEDEADVLDDSLDSNWLQDTSANMDLPLDFSLSPFTSHFLNSQCSTPQLGLESICLDQQLPPAPAKNAVEAIKYQVSPRKLDTIDIKIERALHDNNVEGFSLDALLLSPSVAGKSPMTPTINDILFNGELELEKDYEHSKKKNDNMLEEFFKIVNDGRSDSPIQNAEYTHVGQKELTKKILAEKKPDYCLITSYCNLCDKPFKDAKALKIHFAKFHKVKIKVEAKSSTGDRKVKICDYCAKSFKDCSNFVRHIKAHMNNNRIIKCDVCQLRFSSVSKLKLHKGVHENFNVIETDHENNYIMCFICGKTCSNPKSYARHEKQHSLKKSLHCDVCSKSFFRMYDLKVHIRTHTGEKPFGCPECGESFSRRNALNMHIKRHKGEKTFSCVHCNRRFFAKFYWIAHMKKSKCSKRINLAPSAVETRKTIETFSEKSMEHTNSMEIHMADFIDKSSETDKRTSDEVIYYKDMIDELVTILPS